MVICIIALPVLALLGLFSLKYRILAKEAFHCLFESIQLKPCTSGLDNRIKSKFSAKLMWLPPLARFFYRYFTILSWIFVILLLLSIAFSAYGIYNYAKYGNCNGKQSDGFCIFNEIQPSEVKAIAQNLSIDQFKFEQCLKSNPQMAMEECIAHCTKQ